MDPPLEMQICKQANKQRICLLLTGYITTVLEDATVYSKHAGKKELDADDVQLAIQSRLDHSYTNPPPREVKIFLVHGMAVVSVHNTNLSCFSSCI